MGVIIEYLELRDLFRIKYTTKALKLINRYNINAKYILDALLDGVDRKYALQILNLLLKDLPIQEFYISVCKLQLSKQFKNLICCGVSSEEEQYKIFAWQIKAYDLIKDTEDFNIHSLLMIAILYDNDKLVRYLLRDKKVDLKKEIRQLIYSKNV